MAKPIEQAWQSFREMAFPDATDPQQLADIRKTFFAGAAILFKSLLYGFSKGPEPDEGDERMMDNLENEINEFAREVDDEILSIGDGEPN